ncbi:MAG: gliding motility lipoprotein GldD [Bacteroidales bacterium]|jgi:gliding motility-associated lipoprotein GldD|nr:gliding motility lipoprotein GldD [Bacteroidales bacterium]
MNNPIISLSLVLFSTLCSAGCRQNETPKPRAYFRISFPEKKYVRYESECPFVFEYPVYAQPVATANHTGEPCFFNLVFPKYKATIHLTYKKINNDLNVLLDDDWTFVYKKIAQKADAIEPHHYEDPKNRIYATVYDIKGNAASPVQFYTTDSVRHFLRGSLYFGTRPNYDSLAPSIHFFRRDIVHLIETFRWKND